MFLIEDFLFEYVGLIVLCLFVIPTLGMYLCGRTEL